jgi:hypothetical protein
MSTWRGRVLLWSPVALVLLVLVLFIFFPHAPVLAAVTAVPVWAWPVLFLVLNFALATLAGWHLVRQRRRGLWAAVFGGAAVGASPVFALSLISAVLLSVIPEPLPESPASILIVALIPICLMAGAGALFGLLGGLSASRKRSWHAA